MTALEAARRPRAVFLDRDGTLIREKGYLKDPKQVELEHGAARAASALKRSGFRVVVVTNQSGVARGFYTERDVLAVHQEIARLLGLAGASADGFYYCPHHPRGELEPYRMECSCRKPGTGLLETAVQELGLSMAGSYLVGDKRTDMEAARRAGLTGILVLTGFGRDEWSACLRGAGPGSPDRVARDLSEAADWILWHEGEILGRTSGLYEQRGWSSKWVSLRLLAERASIHRSRGENIVVKCAYTAIYDNLQEVSTRLTREPGEVLVAAITDDRRTPGSPCDPSRARLPMEQRIEVLSRLPSVDYVVTAELEDVQTAIRSDSRVHAIEGAGVS
ncbi:MAG: HAD-IIIA family hydrolase [bacterium]